MLGRNYAKGVTRGPQTSKSQIMPGKRVFSQPFPWLDTAVEKILPAGETADLTWLVRRKQTPFIPSCKTFPNRDLGGQVCHCLPTCPLPLGAVYLGHICVWCLEQRKSKYGLRLDGHPGCGTAIGISKSTEHWKIMGLITAHEKSAIDLLAVFST